MAAGSRDIVGSSLSWQGNGAPYSGHGMTRHRGCICREGAADAKRGESGNKGKW